MAPLEEGDMFSNGLFFITLSSEGLHVRSGERNRTNFPLNELVANDLELAEAALAQEGQNHDALVGFMGVPPPLPESLSGVRTLSPSAPGPQPLAAARTFSTELGDRDDTSAQAIGLRGRFKVVDACSTTLDVNVPMTLPIELQSTDVVAVRIQSLANKEAACTVFIRGGEVHVVDNEGRVRTSLNATHAFDGIPGQYQIEFVQAEGMPTLRLIAQDEAGLLVDVRKVQFRSQATLLDAPTLAERDDVPVSVRAPRLAPRPEGLSDLRLNTRNQVLRNTAMAVGFTIVAAMGAAVATQVKGCMEAHATADVQPVPFPMSND